MPAPELNVAHWIACTEVEGPGKRFAVWTQGCHIRCKGCCNADLLAFVPRHLLSSEKLVAHIEQACRDHGIAGITLLGGEPLIQAQGLSKVAAAARQFGLTVMLFTGFSIDKGDHSLPDGADDLLAHCDVVVDGPYMASRPDAVRNWVGSSNQRFHYLSSAYDSSIETDIRYRHGVEIRIAAHGGAVLNGYPYDLQCALDADTPLKRSLPSQSF